MISEKTKIIKIECTGTEFIEIDSLVSLQGELKSRTRFQLDKLRNQILEKGFSFPVFIWQHENRNFIFDGHCRDEICKELLSEGYLFQNGDDAPGTKIPAVFIFAKNKKEAKEKLLALNSSYGKISEEGFLNFINEKGFELDFEKLKLDLELPDINLEKFEIDYLTNNRKEDDIPDVPIETRIKTGDIFKLGKHILLCGDSTNKENVLEIISNEIDCVFTDPPFDMDFDLVNKCFNNIKEFAKVQFWMGSDKQITRLVSNNYELFTHYFIHDYINPTLTSNSQPMQQHNLIAKFKNQKIINLKDGFSTIIKVPTERIKKEHHLFKMGKNIELPAQFIKHYCFNGVLDIFGGYGSTLIAAEKYNKKCFMIEINPYYCDLINQRFENFTGLKAEKIN